MTGDDLSNLTSTPWFLNLTLKYTVLTTLSGNTKRTEPPDHSWSKNSQQVLRTGSWINFYAANGSFSLRNQLIYWKLKLTSGWWHPPFSRVVIPRDLERSPRNIDGLKDMQIRKLSTHRLLAVVSGCSEATRRCLSVCLSVSVVWSILEGRSRNNPGNGFTRRPAPLLFITIRHLFCHEVLDVDQN